MSTSASAAPRSCQLIIAGASGPDAAGPYRDSTVLTGPSVSVDGCECLKNLKNSESGSRTSRSSLLEKVFS
jgi:hypothetical protein